MCTVYITVTHLEPLIYDPHQALLTPACQEKKNRGLVDRRTPSRLNIPHLETRVTAGCVSDLRLPSSHGRIDIAALCKFFPELLLILDLFFYHLSSPRPRQTTGLAPLSDLTFEPSSFFGPAFYCTRTAVQPNPSCSASFVSVEVSWFRSAIAIFRTRAGFCLGLRCFAPNILNRYLCGHLDGLALGTLRN